MTPIQKATAHILSEMERNGVEITDEIRLEVADILKEKLFIAERDIWGFCMKTFDKRPKSDPPTLKDVWVYQAGAFGLRAFAPGGILEVGEDGKPTPGQRVHLPEGRIEFTP